MHTGILSADPIILTLLGMGSRHETDKIVR